MEFRILIHFIIAIAIGALIGIERQRQRQGGFAGVRTFILISFFGALSGFLYQEFSNLLIVIITFSPILLLIVSSYIVSAQKGYIGITAELSGAIVFFLGFIVMYDKYRDYALIFSVLMTVLLSFKDTLHSFIYQTKEVEWNDTLKFALIAFVILPLLPEKLVIPLFDTDKFPGLNTFYPREIWLLVVFVSGISFIGYFLVKILGGKKGANIVGAIGGLVSSTAVTQSMASHSKTKVKDAFVKANPFVVAAILSTLVSFIRVGIISIGIDRNLYPIIAPMIILIVTALFSIFLVQIRSRDKDVKTDLQLKSPLKLRPALILGTLYAVLTFVSKLSFALDFGKSGIIITSVVTGFFDIDPVILTVSTLSAAGDIHITDAIISILLALCSNQITKSFISLSSGSKRFGITVARILLSFVIIILGWIFLLNF